MNSLSHGCIEVVWSICLKKVSDRKNELNSSIVDGIGQTVQNSDAYY
jgi:hypothetical protein